MRRFLKLTASILLLWTLAASSALGAGNMPAGVQSFAPTGTVPDNVSFRAVFRNPVVTRAQTGKILTPDNPSFPFEVNPPLQLEGRWQNERTFTAKLLAPLRSATTYTATLRDNLRDRRGGRIGPGTFHFQTEGLSPTDIKASMGRDGSAYFTLNFNMRVDPARLKGFMRIINPEGKEVPYTINGALPSRTIRAAVNVNKSPSRQRFTVRIAAGLKSGEGDLGIEDDYSQSVVLDPELMVESINPQEEAIRAEFNFGVDPQTVKSFITIEPMPEGLTFENGWNDEYLVLRSEQFKPRDRFVLTFKKGFPSKGGLVLKEDYRQAIIMPDLDPEVSLPASGTYLTPLNEGLIPIELRNIKRLQLDLWRMYDNNIPYVIRGEYDSFQRDIARRVFTKEIALALPLNTRVKRNIPVDEIAKGQRGLFLLTARDADGEYWSEAEQIINLTDMGAAARLWEDAILVWVNSLTGAKGVSDAEVKIFSGAKQVIASGRTNNAGVFYHELPKGEVWPDGAEPELAIITKGEDVVYIQLTRNLLTREIFDTSGRDWLKKGYDGAIISPRDIYRVGETAQFKAIVRNTDITTASGFPVKFEVKDGLGRRIKDETVTLNARGSGVFTLDIPNNALTGLWSVSLAIPGQESKPITTYKFHVEDFAPPRIEVKLSSYRKFLVHNDTFTADIYSRWLFGVDGAGLKYKTSWTAREGTFEPTQDRWKGYAFGDPSRRFTATEGDLEEGQLDNFGAAHANLKLDSDWEAPTVINVTLKAEVMEDGGRWITSTLTRPYFSAPYLLGIAPASDKFAVRTNIAFKVAGITPEEEPADPGQLKAELYKVTWNYNMIEIDGRKRWQSTEELSLVDEKSLTLKNGLGEVSFRPEDYGTYLVRISDEDDNARAVYRFYATDPQYSGGGSQLIDRIEVIPDKDTYRLGETAHVKIKAPFSGLMMITVENGSLLERNVRIVEESELTYDIKITQDMRPNAWITAWLIRPVQQSDAGMWASHRAVGLARLKADMSDCRITVDINAPKKAVPASKIPVTITLKAASDTIAKNADVAVAFVDDGVLGLTRYKTPDLLNHFWGLKKLNSEGFDIYDQLIPVEDRTTEQLHPGGDEAMAVLAPDGNVQRFKILSLFEGVLYPDDNGTITTELEIPEFSGRGRLYVVAASGRSFGNAEQLIEIARDIVTEAGLPRFSTPNDEFTVPMSVFNTSPSNQSVKLSLTPHALTLSESFTTLNIPAGGKSAFTTTAKTLPASSRAELAITTSWPEGEFTQTIELPLRSAWPTITQADTGTFAPGTTRITIPTNTFTGDVTGTLTLAASPAVNLTKAVEFLRSYPYACLEQTISGAWPFLILPDAVAELDPETLTDSSLKIRTQGAINRIQSMQLYDGSFSMWPNTNTTHTFGSVYAAHFLLKARDAGVVFPEEMLTGALNWIRQYLPSMPAYHDDTEELDDFTTKAYAVYVLALNGEKPLGWVEYLRENISSLRPSGRIYLAGAQSLIDGNAEALRSIELGSNSGYSGRTLESDTRNVAVLLTMWLDVEPRAAEVTELAARLVALGNNGKWFSTQDNAWALVALARYNVEAAGAKSEITARVTTETSDSALLTYDGKSTVSIRVEDLPKNGEILIEAQGTGQGYYSWNITGLPTHRPKAERRNINVECVYFDDKGNILDLSKPLPHGSVIQAVLTMKPSMTVNNLVVNYLLPAGLEIENPRLEDGAANPSGSYGIVNDIRDDRLTLFVDTLSGERSYGFKMRAVTRGKFTVPQISAYGMYDATVRFTGQPQPLLEIR